MAVALLLTAQTLPDILWQAGTRACSCRSRGADLCNTPQAGAPIESVAPFSDFAQVSSDEMAFALTLFVEAANRGLSTTAKVHQHEDELCEQLYVTLCAEAPRLPTVECPQPDHHTTLYTAFRTLCRHYTGDTLQAAVCARVLAFHFLMERTAGNLLSEWVRPHPETVKLVVLHPAVVEAIATTSLHGSVLLGESVFLDLVAQIGRNMVRRAP